MNHNTIPRKIVSLSILLGIFALPWRTTAAPPPQLLALRSLHATGAATGEHPLDPILRWAKQGLPALQEVKDYSATFVKREQVDGKLGDEQTYLLKVRQKPFSVFTRALAPAEIKGQEALYVEGQNDGNLWAHPAGVKGRFVRALALKPTGNLAMQDARYPITEIGIVNLVETLIEVAEQDAKHDECTVKHRTGQSVDGRPCECVEVVHPKPRPYFRYHLAKIFVDEELKILIRYEAYTWPTKAGAEPELLERYEYRDLKINNGFTDMDFSIDNPEYHFRCRK